MTTNNLKVSFESYLLNHAKSNTRINNCRKSVKMIVKNIKEESTSCKLFVKLPQRNTKRKGGKIDC